MQTSPHSVLRQLDTFLRKKRQTLGQNVYLARGSVWWAMSPSAIIAVLLYNAVLRGRHQSHRRRQLYQYQDNAVLHLADELPCLVGHYVTIGHSAIVHACVVHDECLIGMGRLSLTARKSVRNASLAPTLWSRRAPGFRKARWFWARRARSFVPSPTTNAPG